jgi:hypothetical protein
MRLLIVIPCIVAVIASAAWLVVHVTVLLDSRAVSFAYLWAFLGIAVLTSLFILLGESLIEDAVKAGLFIGLSLFLLRTRMPALIPCTAIAAAIVAFVTNQLSKRRHDTRA